MKKHYIIPIFVPHKGCPHNCVFCNQRKITGHSEVIDSAFVEKEINEYLKTIPDGDRLIEVSFFGGSFTGIPINEQIKLLEPAKQALDDGKINAIRLSTRPDYIDEVILDNLKKYKVSIIELGVQSMDDEVLSLSGRGHTADNVFKACNLIKEYGFTLGLQMMVGLPGDKLYKDLKTADEFINIKPQMVRIYPTLVIKDTCLEDMYKEGSYNSLSLDNAVDICSRLYLKFTAVDIKIIRIGLQPTENINIGRDIVAGPFHPAIRELIESKIINDMIEYLCKSRLDNNLTIYINSKMLSKLYADKKRYFKVMLSHIKHNNLYIYTDDSINCNTIVMKDNRGSLSISMKEYCLIKGIEGIITDI